jgi:ABC-type multidrug transport system fused ATPase/permease subunit
MQMKNSPFWSLFITYRRYYVTAIVFTLLGWLSTFAVPVIIKNLIDGIFAVQPAEMSGVVGYFMTLFGGKSYLAGHLWIAALFIIFFFCLNALFRHFTARFSGIACESILMELRNRLYSNFQELPDSFYSKSPAQPDVVAVEPGHCSANAFFICRNHPGKYPVRRSFGSG